MNAVLEQVALWPDPDGLEKSQIDTLLDELRGRREALMGVLRTLQMQVSAGAPPAVFVDLMEARLGLNALLSYWRRLLSRMMALETWTPLGSDEPCFAELREYAHGRSARAIVPLTPDSMLFVHGPVVLWHAAALAEGMLAPGDRLTRLIRGSFRRELTVEPYIVLWDRKSGAPEDIDGATIAADGMFATASGRELAFAALPAEGHVPRRRAGWHPLTARVIAACPEKSVAPAVINHAFAPADFPSAERANRGSSILLAKAEALLAAFTQHILVGERIFLLSRGLNIVIDANLGEWLAATPQVQFEIDWNRQKEIPGRGAFVPFRYRISPDDAQWQRTAFVSLDSHLAF